MPGRWMSQGRAGWNPAWSRRAGCAPGREDGERRGSFPMRICLLLMLLPSLCWAKAPSPEGERWWSHVEALASDEMEGRDTGSPGYLRAAEYVAAKLTEAGVQPGTPGG